MSDRIKSVPDVPWRPVGAGMAPTFRCPRCNLPKGTPGRRKQRVRGLLDYVCRECVR
jgi:hypothetical protein